MATGLIIDKTCFYENIANQIDKMAAELFLSLAFEGELGDREKDFKLFIDGFTKFTENYAKGTCERYRIVNAAMAALEEAEK